MKMNCRRTLNLAEPMRDGSVGEADAKAWRDHLETCPKCRQILREDQRLADTLRVMNEWPEVPADLHARVTAALKSEARWRPKGPSARRGRLIRATLAAGALIVLVVVGLFAPMLAPHPINQFAGKPGQGPTMDFPFGTDKFGQDVFSRVIRAAPLGSMTSIFISSPWTAGRRGFRWA